LLRRALDLRAALKLGIRITLDEIRADELHAMLTIDEEETAFARQQHGEDYGR